MAIIKSCIVFLLLTTPTVQQIPTFSEVDYIAGVISSLIDDNFDIQGGIREYPFIAGFVRLAFNDCVGDGKCDGCINHNLADNKGLKRYTDVLDTRYTGDPAINSKLTRADFYILAAYVALEHATETKLDKITWSSHFRIGRESCITSPDETGNDIPSFPSGMGNFSDIYQFLSNEFGFTLKDSVAIMGPPYTWKM